MEKIYVYIVGPLTTVEPDTCGGRIARNINDAITVADELMELGLIPFVPHLSQFWDIVSPKDYEDWMSYDLAWLEKCNVLLRLPGDSAGADREVQRARELGMYVYYSIDDLKAAWQATIEAEL